MEEVFEKKRRAEKRCDWQTDHHAGRSDLTTKVMNKMLRPALKEVWRGQEHPGDQGTGFLACTKHDWGTILWCVSELNCDMCLKHTIITCFTPKTEVWLTPMIHLSHTSVDKFGFSNRLCPCNPEKITWQDAPFTSTSFPSTEDRQIAAEWIDGQRVAVWCHVGVYLSTTTGRNTSRAQPGQGQWIWLGQAAKWMARGKGGEEG